MTGAPAAIEARGSSPLSPTIIFNNLRYLKPKEYLRCAQSCAKFQIGQLIPDRLEAFIGQRARKATC